MHHTKQIKKRPFISIAVLACMILAYAPSPLMAQTGGNPIVFSKTVVSIVPGTVIPKAVLKDATQTQNEANVVEDVTEAAGTGETVPDKTQKEIKASLEMQVRGQQIPLNSGMYTKYKLDNTRGVLTYYPTVETRSLQAENIYEPVDILFVRDDGIIAQIVPEVILAYLREEVEIGFDLRATIYLTAGLSESLGIQPGDRVDHGMFTPKPYIQKVDEEQ